jgi:hypothetical protein
MVGESVFFDWRHAQMQSSSEYLTLALDVREVTDLLIELVEQGAPSDRLDGSIRQVMLSLQGTGQATVKSLRDRGFLGRYVGVRTLNEVFSDEQREEFAGTLKGVIEPQSPEQRTESALAAIPFFDALERRALYDDNRAKTARRYTPSR